jgi:hypothetical protein
MAKAKCNDLKGFRIELQDKERQILEQYLFSESVLNYAQAFDQFTSFENLYLLVTVIEIITGKEIIPGTPNDVYKIIDFLRDYDWKSLLPDIDIPDAIKDQPGGVFGAFLAVTPLAPLRFFI